MAKEYKAADGTSYTLRLSGRRGEALHAFWAGKTSPRDTLSAFRGLAPSAAPSDPDPKATSHRVVDTRPEGFVVLSGTSGRTYLIVPLGKGGATCTCEHGRASSALAVRCSHVRAVEMWVKKQNAEKRAKAASDPAMVQCWSCDGSGEVTIQPVYESRRTRAVVAEKPQMQRCLHCGGLGYVKKGE